VRAATSVGHLTLDDCKATDVTAQQCFGVPLWVAVPAGAGPSVVLARIGLAPCSAGADSCYIGRMPVEAQVALTM